MSRHQRACAICAALLLTSVAAPAALAQAGPQYLGQWKSDNPASAAPDAILTIAATRFSWQPKPKAPTMCGGTLALQEEKPGTVYLDARGRKFVAGAPGSFPTYLFKVEPGACGGADGWRISFPLAYDRRHMELTEYRNGRQTGYRKMQRAD